MAINMQTGFRSNDRRWMRDKLKNDREKNMASIVPTFRPRINSQLRRAVGRPAIRAF
jgi:hypothetical protein